MKAKKTASKKTSSEKPATTLESSSAAAPNVLDERQAEELVAKHGHLLEGMPKKRVRISVVTLTDHADTILKIATPNEAKLVSVGLDARILHELPLRVSLARACQAIRQFSHRSFTKEEVLAIGKCQSHRDEMMRICRHAFRKDKLVQEDLTALQEGSGVKDLYEDTTALIHLIRKNADVVRTTGYDPAALVAEAEAHQDAIKDISPERTMRTKGGSEEVARRNQAVHYLLEGLREIRENAAFAFAKDSRISTVLQGLGTMWQAAKKASEEEDDDDGEDGEDPVV